MVSFDRLDLGKQSEDLACQFLVKKGFSLLQKNYRCYHGEIDLIMQDKEDIVFVEVRSRTRNEYGSALESINNYKIKKILKTATHFLQKRNWLYKRNSRFDIIAIDLNASNLESVSRNKSFDQQAYKIDWLKNAFM